MRTAGLRVAPGARPVVNVLFDATPGARFARLTLRDFEGGARVRVLARPISASAPASASA